MNAPLDADPFGLMALQPTSALLPGAPHAAQTHIPLSESQAGNDGWASTPTACNGNRAAIQKMDSANAAAHDDDMQGPPGSSAQSRSAENDRVRRWLASTATAGHTIQHSTTPASTKRPPLVSPPPSSSAALDAWVDKLLGPNFDVDSEGEGPAPPKMASFSQAMPIYSADEEASNKEERPRASPIRPCDHCQLHRLKCRPSSKHIKRCSNCRNRKAGCTYKRVGLPRTMPYPNEAHPFKAKKVIPSHLVLKKRAMNAFVTEVRRECTALAHDYEDDTDDSDEEGNHSASLAPTVSVVIDASASQSSPFKKKRRTSQTVFVDIARLASSTSRPRPSSSRARTSDPYTAGLLKDTRAGLKRLQAQRIDASSLAAFTLALALLLEGFDMAPPATNNRTLDTVVDYLERLKNECIANQRSNGASQESASVSLARALVDRILSLVNMLLDED